MFEGAAIEGWCSVNRTLVEMRVETHRFFGVPNHLDWYIRKKKLLY